MPKSTSPRFSTAKLETKTDDKRSRVSQTDVPAYSLGEALRVAKAIAENYGYKSVAPLKVAQALKISPSSSTFAMLCGASIGYGLTEGGYHATEISLTALGLRIVKPKAENDEKEGMREAFMRPNVIKAFLQKYHSAPLPREDIALNVLHDMGVPKERGSAVLQLIFDEAEHLGFLQDIKGKKYVYLEAGDQSQQLAETALPDSMPSNAAPEIRANNNQPTETHASQPESGRKLSARKRKVFITHGKNQNFIAPIKKLLSFGELESVVSVEKQSVSVPVPEKVMNDMRDCGGAIIHVEGEEKVIDSTATERHILNPNVLIEIGGAMALYGRRFILLVKDGIKLPSNLQGLYEVRYKDELLDGDTTIKLLEAINDLKRQPLPEEVVNS